MTIFIYNFTIILW